MHITPHPLTHDRLCCSVVLLAHAHRYTAFANNLETALATINECRRQPSFVLYLEFCKENRAECLNQWLHDHLLAPIQRITKCVRWLSPLSESRPFLP